jgi:type 1 glutamine amidotransferase
MMKLALSSLILGAMILSHAFGGEEPKRVLFFSKSAGYEHAVAYRDTAWPSFIEREMLALGNERHIDFTFTKDGSIFTPENIAKYDAFFFYTSGDLTRQPRDGWGDNYPLMTVEGKAALLRAIHDGKGFVGVHCAIDTFSNDPDPTAPDPSTPGSYGQMLGARYLRHGGEQPGHLIPFDSKFPGMEKTPANFHPVDQWSALRHFMPDIHVIMGLDCAKMRGELYARPNYPIAWARMEGKGRVFYTAMGHAAEIWKDPAFQEMIFGGIRWATGMADADITPNLTKTTPPANEIPERAKQETHSEHAGAKSD